MKKYNGNYMSAGYTFAKKDVIVMLFIIALSLFLAVFLYPFVSNIAVIFLASQSFCLFLWFHYVYFFRNNDDLEDFYKHQRLKRENKK